MRSGSRNLVSPQFGPAIGPAVAGRSMISVIRFSPSAFGGRKNCAPAMHAGDVEKYSPEPPR